MPGAEPTTILIVEDDEGVRLLQRRALKRAGYKVLVASLPAEALQIVQERSVDLVVLDYQLPGGSTGIDLYARFKSAGHDLPVIIVTGYSNESTAIAALREGVRDYVPKLPDYLDHLPRSVERVLQQVRMEQALWEKEEQLRHAQKMEALGALAGGVAHEFNNLLQAVQSFSRFAQEGLSAEDPRFADLEQVLAASDRAAKLTRQLLGFSRRESPTFGVTDANRLVEDVVKMLRPLLGANIETTLELGHAVGTVNADAGQIQQVIMNLCINARDAMPGGGRIVVKTERIVLHEPRPAVAGDMSPGPYLQLTVTDTGAGISQENLERIFEPFFTTKATGKGTGLGLALVFSIVHQHQGHIRVDSTLGEGTTFGIYLPVVEQAAAPDVHTARVEAGGQGELLLVSDDEALVRNAAVRILERAGYRTLSAADGYEAVALIRSYADEITVIISDLIMPGLSGAKVSAEARRVKPDLPVIFWTSSDATMAEFDFAAIRDARVLQKPFTPAELLMAVREAIETTVGAGFACR